MSDLLLFETDSAGTSKSSKGARTDDPLNGPPCDNFEVQVHFPVKTIFYLTVTTPHTETFEVHGPARQFSMFRSKIEQLVAKSSSAKKLEDLAEDKPDVFISGFRTFVIELENGQYTRLDVIREVNPSVHEHLPAPVFLVTSHGPMTHEFDLVGRTSQSVRRRGYAASSRLVSSFTDYEVAKYHATRAMDAMLQQKEARTGSGIGVLRKNTDDTKSAFMSNWMSMAMDSGNTWEAKVTVVKEINKGRTNTFNMDI